MRYCVFCRSGSHLQKGRPSRYGMAMQNLYTSHATQRCPEPKGPDKVRSSSDQSSLEEKNPKVGGTWMLPL
ncbi:BQ5605_C011g06560 [Microbotryum silenes-dioicae]|uniref:BQ5605_C011g06560 protein n=1 Tax=Microbotryum silenes-dioicae TaxID=796604 RepID=A0A2X0LTV2_9BASI|nr:BQ5605_C011g06560 [Microbotryum silenes-dioicae]